jgi:hypothetical protein
VLLVRYENFVRDPAGQGELLLQQLAEVLPAEPLSKVDPSRAEGFVSPEMRHHRSGAKNDLNPDVLTYAQVELARWLAELPEGWTELQPPAELSAQPAMALTAATEYYDMMGDRYGMETAYDLERHKALHFEQATELKDQHIANIESAVGGLRRQVEEQQARLKELEDELRATAEAKGVLEAQLLELQHDSRAAATNLLATARRSLGGHAPRPA